MSDLAESLEQTEMPQYEGMAEVIDFDPDAATSGVA